MDGSRFDGWTRALTTGASRRRTLRGVAGGALAGLLAHLGLEEAAAACVKPGKKGCKGPRNKQCCKGAACRGGTKKKTGQCVCSGTLKKCGSACVNIQTNKEHCGGCNTPCGAGETCANGTCECPATRTQCGMACVDPETDTRHCGECNNSCAGEACEQGICRTPDQGTCSQAYDVCIPHPGVNVSCNQVANQGECKCSKRLNGRPFCGIGMRCGCLSDADCSGGAVCVVCTELCADFGNTGCASPCPVGP